MFEGGISFNKESDKAVRRIALFGTPVFVGYNLLVMFGIVHSPYFAGWLICLIVCTLWLAAGGYHYFARIRSRRDMMWRLIIYQALALGTIVFVTGFFQPFAASVVLLFLAANIYFGRKGLVLSLLSVILVATIDIILNSPAHPAIVIDNILGVTGILILGISLVAIVTAQETRRLALLESQSQERLQYDRILTIINNLSDATLSTDENGEVLLYNAASLNLLDTNDNLRGKNINDLFNLTDSDKKPVSLFEVLHTSRNAMRRDDIRHTYSDGEEIRLEITYAPIKSAYTRHKNSQSQAGYVLIVRDITKQKSTEEERDEFISVISHELRTPVAIVEGTLSNLQYMMNLPKAPAQALVESSITVAHDQVLYLAKMVNDLSTLSRAERGVGDEAEDIDVDELMHKMFKEYSKSATARKLHLNLDLGTKLGTVHVSRLYLEELLQNFITNAIKYTNEGTVTACAKVIRGKVHFSIKDSGIGISRSDQQKIFNKFYRSEDYRIRETNGTGLGLYVSAKLARKLGTQIKLTSRLNHGSNFSFELTPITKK